MNKITISDETLSEIASQIGCKWRKYSPHVDVMVVFYDENHREGTLESDDLCIVVRGIANPEIRNFCGTIPGPGHSVPANKRHLWTDWENRRSTVETEIRDRENAILNPGKYTVGGKVKIATYQTI